MLVLPLIDNGMVREYRFGYTLSGATGRSRLTTLAECAGDGTCLPATQMGWPTYNDSDSNFAGSGSGMWTGHSGGMSNNVVGDFNGDGRTDIAGYSTSQQQWHVCMATGANFSCVFWNGPTEGIANTISGDFNGDGRTDLAGRTGTVVSGLRQWRVCLSSGSDFSCSLWLGQQAEVTNTIIGDFDGDGRTDFAGYSSGVQWHVCLSSGSSFSCAMWNGHSGGTNNNVLGDLNGDGRTDITGYDALRAQWHVCLSNGAGFDCSYWLGHRGGSVGNITGDFNGDSLTDFAGYDSNLRLWDVCLSTGASFTCGYRAIHQGGAENNAVGDFNGDGRTDMAGYTGSNGLWHVCLSTGEEFNCGTHYWTGHAAAIGANIVGDFNGDGKSDLMGYPGSGNLWHVTLSSGPIADLVTSITNGHSARVELNYRPLNDPAIYTKDTDANYPKRDVAGPIYVVASHSTDDGRGGRWQTNYRYAGLKVNLRGRGFLGFRFIRATDALTGIATTSFYGQEGAFKALLWKVERRLANGTLISYVERGWAAQQSGTIFYSYIHAERNEQYELDGTLVYSNTTTTTIDGYGNPTQVDLRYNDGFWRTITNTYTNDTSRWLLGQLTRVQVSVQSPGQTAVTRVSIFTHDTASAQVLSEVVEPGSTLALTKAYAYDGFGNLVRSTQNGADVAARTVQSEFNPKGRFVVRSVNPLGQAETRANDSRFGTPTSVTGLNGLTTTWVYDAYGRATLERRPDATQTMTSYRRCGTAACPARAVYLVSTETAGLPPKFTYFDLLDRPIREETVGFDGRSIYVDTEYGVRGNKARVSNPYFVGQTPVWTVFEYDDVDRLIAATTPDGSRTITAYRGLTTTVTNPLNQIQKRVVNNQSWLMRSTDTAGAAISYSYDSGGNLLAMADPAGNITRMTYDLHGRQLSLSAPGAGTTSFQYNAVDELVWQRNARGQETQLRYDALGRLIERQAPEGISRWVYDTQPNGIGKLASVQGPDGFQEASSYDALGRPAETTTTIDGSAYTIALSYDSVGRVAGVTYPTGLRTQNTYNARGYLSEVRNATTQALFWRAEAINAQGQLERETLGNGLQTSRNYDPLTGRIATVATGQPTTPTTVQNLTYTFDRLGNLLSRSDRSRNLTETFGYDTRNRLTSAQVASQAATTVTYDQLGNILTKSDVGTYSYGQNGFGPYAVTSISGTLNRTYGYDADGNRLSSSTGTIAYTSFNKPSRIVEGSQQLTFGYNPDLTLFRQVSQAGTTMTTTSYVGGLYEREVTGAQTTHRQSIATGGTRIIYVTKNGVAPQTLWLQTDHLGSVDTVTNEMGQVVERQSFDAWGKPRTIDWKPLAIALASLTNRGFNGHEQLFSVSLIHMGGRVYDPAVGRFLSQDPLVQAPDNVQNLNRYSYVLNRPLSLTDPSGYSWLGDLGERIGNFFKGNWKTIAVVVVSVATMSAVASAGWATGLLAPLGATPAASGAIVAGAASGFVGGVSGTLLYGGSLSQALQNGLHSAIAGGVLASIGQAIPSWSNTVDYFPGTRLSIQISRTLANGVAKGLMAQLNGGTFRQGFRLSILSETVRWGMEAYAEEGYRANCKQDCGLTWKRGEGGPSIKDNDTPVKDANVLNAGKMWNQDLIDQCQCQLENITWREQDFWWKYGAYEGMAVSHLANFFPGMNTMSIFHDVFAHRLEGFIRSVDLPSSLFNVLNVATIAPAIPLTYIGLDWGNINYQRDLLHAR